MKLQILFESRREDFYVISNGPADKQSIGVIEIDGILYDFEQGLSRGYWTFKINGEFITVDQPMTFGGYEDDGGWTILGDNKELGRLAIKMINKLMSYSDPVQGTSGGVFVKGDKPLYVPKNTADIWHVVDGVVEHNDWDGTAEALPAVYPRGCPNCGSRASASDERCPTCEYDFADDPSGLPDF